MKRVEIDAFVWNVLMDSVRHKIIDNDQCRDIYQISLDVDPAVQQPGEELKCDDARWITIFSALRDGVDSYGVINAVQMDKIIGRVQLYLQTESERQFQEEELSDGSAREEAEKNSHWDAMALFFTGQPLN